MKASPYVECFCGKTVHQQGLDQHQQQKHGGASAPVCGYCDEEANLVDGSVVYPHRRDLAHEWFYVCHTCGARVGCHRGTKKPLGILANDQLRKLKSRCHAIFDPIWREFKNLGDRGARHKSYKWLAETLDIPREECHFGMFDDARAKRAIAVLDARKHELEKLLHDDWQAYTDAKL